MTIIIKVNNLQNQCGANTINKCGTAITVGASGDTTTVAGNILKSNALQAADGGNLVNQCGTTITLGASGDTINLASGASQTGFGRTGTVDWDTTAKTTGFTAVSGNGYFVNTTAGAITVTLPTSPSAGDIVAVADYAGTAATNNITIGRNGSNIEGGTTDGTISTNRETKTLVYVDGTQGWVPVNDNFDSTVTPTFITATGGTITTVNTNYKVHTFTGPGTFTVCSVGNAAGSNTVDYLVVAGGATGGIGFNASGGGGGAGGLRFSASTFTAPCTSAPRAGSALSVTASSYPITVGGGGTVSGPGNPDGVQGGPGSNSIFSTITSTGGGGGGGYRAPIAPGLPGGSGGGGGGDTSPAINASGGAGNTPPTTPSQGSTGGGGFSTGPWYPAGGGGGAGAVGTTNPAPGHGGPGGVGLQINIDTNTNYWAGGGGGAGWQGANGGNGGLGGGGGGATYSATGGSGGGSALNSGAAGTNSWPSNSVGGAGGANTGGGAGGSNCSPAAKGNGGSGIVIIRYKFQN